MKFSLSLYLIAILTAVLTALVFWDRMRSDYIPMSDGFDAKTYLELVAVILAILLLILQIFKEFRDLRK